MDYTKFNNNLEMVKVFEKLIVKVKPHVVSVRYCEDDDREYLVTTLNNGYVYETNVTGNSYMAIIEDWIRTVGYK